MALVCLARHRPIHLEGRPKGPALELAAGAALSPSMPQASLQMPRQEWARAMTEQPWGHAWVAFSRT